jgi:ketosteroid isomerase-like protein
MNNTELIHHFYQSFALGEAEEMVACYDDEIVFTDPAFGALKGNDAKDMWRMLIHRSKGNLKISFDNVKADDTNGSANWVAEYEFAQTGRKVINQIAAHFEFKNGKILKHTDHFDLWKWTRQAMGWRGFLLGWTPFIQHKIRTQTNQLLKSYQNRMNSKLN